MKKTAPGAQRTAGAWQRGCLVGIVLERLDPWVQAMKQEGTGEQILQPLSLLPPLEILLGLLLVNTTEQGNLGNEVQAQSNKQWIWSVLWAWEGDEMTKKKRK